MKKYIAALALLAWASPAGAQERLDLTPAASPPQNFGIIADSRLMLNLHVPSFTTVKSENHALPMQGTILEAWVTLVDGVDADKSLYFHISRSPKNGSTLQEVCTIAVVTTAGMGGDTVNQQCRTGVRFNEGDALVLSSQPKNRSSGAAATLSKSAIANVVLRYADH